MDPQFIFASAYTILHGDRFKAQEVQETKLEDKQLHIHYYSPFSPSVVTVLVSNVFRLNSPKRTTLLT